MKCICRGSCTTTLSEISMVSSDYEDKFQNGLTKMVLRVKLPLKVLVHVLRSYPHKKGQGQIIITRVLRIDKLYE